MVPEDALEPAGGGGQPAALPAAPSPVRERAGTEPAGRVADRPGAELAGDGLANGCRRADEAQAQAGEAVELAERAQYHQAWPAGEGGHGVAAVGVGEGLVHHEPAAAAGEPGMQRGQPIRVQVPSGGVVGIDDDQGIRGVRGVPQRRVRDRRRRDAGVLPGRRVASVAARGAGHAGGAEHPRQALDRGLGARYGEPFTAAVGLRRRGLQAVVRLRQPLPDCRRQWRRWPGPWGDTGGEVQPLRGRDAVAFRRGVQPAAVLDVVLSQGRPPG
ncbi:hypothetical protein KBTX_03662 [wastewater metagenome]|uniref:Uncharacterized protein n=2 Tax=unclassified sequences TaxID=12908 RepID=A0A5B8RH72_9ZZZZ|nr:hypothetical protein KBTEX_03662 [uncultured organism]